MKKYILLIVVSSFILLNAADNQEIKPTFGNNYKHKGKITRTKFPFARIHPKVERSQLIISPPDKLNLDDQTRKKLARFKKRTN